MSELKRCDYLDGHMEGLCGNVAVFECGKKCYCEQHWQLMRSREIPRDATRTDPRILEMIERFNFSPSHIGYAALTQLLEAFALDYYHRGLDVASKIIHPTMEEYSDKVEPWLGLHDFKLAQNLEKRILSHKEAVKTMKICDA